MKKVNLNIRIEEEMRDEFKRIADENAQSPSALIRKWIEKYIEENKEEIKMFNKLNETNSTIIEFDGTELRTVDNPYLDGDVYKAIAVDQYDNKYQITWEIIHPDFNELTDESEACDWDNPVSVEKL
jgi:predicted DNA-binding protein